MNFHKYKLSALILSSTLFITGCNTTKQTSNMYLQSNAQADEKRIIKRSKEFTTILDKHENTIHKDSINTYPNAILESLLKDDKLYHDNNIKFSIKIIKNPTLNAFALPDGSIYLHTGIISKMENEAQLAMLIGHEMSHVTHRHSLQKHRNHKENATAFEIFRTLTIGLDFGLISSLLYNSSISGYSQAKENEADLEGMNQVIAAGYDPKEAAKLFDLMLKDIELNDIKEPYFFSTHPKVKDRIKSTGIIINEKYPNMTGRIGTEKFQRYIKPILEENIELDLKLKRFKSAKSSIDTYIKRYNQNAYGHYLLAEYHRLNLEEKDYSKSQENYKISLNKEPKTFNSYKGLGYIYLKEKKKDQAKKAFEKYLALNTNAKDKGYIKKYIALCSKKEN